jgi:ABC-type multidrug transport system fused ATPase/permease subunit
MRRIAEAVFDRLDRRRMLGVSVLNTADSMLLLVLPWLAGRLADGLFGPAPAVSIGWIALGLFLLAALRAAAGITATLVSGTISTNLTLSLQEWLLERVLRLDYLSYLRRQTGDLLSAVIRDADAVADFVSKVIPSVLPNAVVLIGSVVILATITPLLAISMVPAIVLVVLLLRLWTRRNRPLARQMQDAYAAATASAESAIDMLPALKWLAAERRAVEAFATANRDVAAWDLRWRRRVVPVQPLVYLSAFGGALLVLIGAGAGSESVATPGALIALLLYAGLAARPLASFASQFGQFSAAIGAADRMTELMAAPTDRLYGEQLPPDADCVIALESVSFAWPERDPIIAGLTGTIPSGAWVAIVGANGSGKTSLLQLIGRMVIPTSGRILLSGVDLAKLSVSSLRDSVAAVPQQAWLLHGTIEANLRIARPAATDHEIERACQLSDLGSLLSTLPAGLGTVIGPHGLRLSGGQQQRLMIARALLRDAPILLLDEATSMFDLEAQRAFFRVARMALVERTVIYVSHDPELVSHADLIIEMPACTLRRPGR